MVLRVLIVDDEPLARERLRDLLAAEPTVEVVGLCSNGREALASINRERPDVILLDVQMPEMDGFDLVKSLPQASLPLVVLVTAHDKYALQAFDVQVVDYLLKPFDRERLRETLRRIQERIRELGVSLAVEHLRDRPAPPPPSAPAPEQIPIKSDGRILFIKVNEIDWIGAADNYTEVHVGHASHLHRSTLTAFEARLPREQFVRINRSTIVNISRVKEILLHRNGDGTVILANNTRLSLSRAQRSNLAELLGRK